MLESNRLKDQPESGRPRERLAREGADALSNAELVAILLRTGLKGTNVVEVAQQVLNKFRTLRELANASLPDLCEVKGIGRDKAVTLLAAFALARKMARELQIDSPPLDSPEAIATLLRDHVSFRETETLHVILLNTRRRLINIYKIADGTLDTLLVHSREVFREAIRQNASAIVLAHNHPSGDPTPSEADVKVTKDLVRAGAILKIEVLDHIVLGRKSQSRSQDWMSLRDLGYFAGL